MEREGRTKDLENRLLVYLTGTRAYGRGLLVTEEDVRGPLFWTLKAGRVLSTQKAGAVLNQLCIF